MYTSKHSAGKFQGNSSELLARVVYNASLDMGCETLGDVDTFGFYAYVHGKRNDYILYENSHGFVYVEYGPPAKMQAVWARIEKDYAKLTGDSDEE